MIRSRWGLVKRMLYQSPELEELEVELGGELARAYNYPRLAGSVAVGERVLLNTTAVELGLGTGGRHFVLPQKEGGELGAGHLMQLRYTPLQFNRLSVEEEDSPFHEQLKECESLDGLPVVVGTLHSQLPPMAAGLRFTIEGERRGGKIAYIMTDDAALPLDFSRLVPRLKAQGLIDFTITLGSAYGGDYEAVNIYSALLAAKVLGADAVLVSMGPGIVGTGTTWGTTALSQGEIINAVSVLGGRAVAVPRISFADPRGRHRGISHHTLTALGKVALRSAILALPKLPQELAAELEGQLGGLSQHHFAVREGSFVLDILAQLEIPLSTMGRGVEEERPFFLAAAAGGICGAELVEEV